MEGVDVGMGNRIAGIYMIRNKKNGKVYIGQSVDIDSRIKKYLWAAKNPDATYHEAVRDIIKDMRVHGLKNFDFTILETGPKYEDTEFRLNREIKLIAEYNCMNPHGYNLTPGGEYGPTKPRAQGFLEKISRAKAVWLYDCKNNNVRLFFTGAKGVGDKLGYGKDVMSHTVKRGSMVDKRYYIIPANFDDRHKILEKIKAKKVDNDFNSQRAKSRAGNVFNKYKEVVEIIDKIEHFD